MSLDKTLYPMRNQIGFKQYNPDKPAKYGEGASPCRPKRLNFHLLLDKNITYWEIPHIGEKGISNSF